MIFQIDRVNALLFLAGLPTVDRADYAYIRNRKARPSCCPVACGLARLEMKYELSAYEDWTRARKLTSGARYRQMIEHMKTLDVVLGAEHIERTAGIMLMTAEEDKEECYSPAT